MVKVGIIGLGFMAATHIRAYQEMPGVKIAAICNPSGRHLDGDLSRVTGNLDTGQPLKLDMREVLAYREVSELLSNRDVDLVDICTPTSSHVALSVAGLEAGKHVLCEKPMTRSVEAARQIVRAVEKARTFFMPAMCLRFWPEWVWLKEAIAEERYGKVLGARFRRVAEPPGWGQRNFFNGAESGGALVDLHIHDTDFVQFCFGRPRGVFSTGYSKFSGAVDHVVTQYLVEGGASVHAEGGWSMTPGFGFTMSYTVNFENATVDYDVGRGEESLKLFAQDKEPEIIKCEGPDGYVRELRHMTECIENGAAPSVVTAEDGLQAVEICEAEEKSVASGEYVTLEREQEEKGDGDREREQGR